VKKIAAIAVAVGLVLAACGSDDDTSETTVAEAMDDTMAAGDIVAVAAATEGFSTLVAAIEAAGLVETLQGDGPFTVFAPDCSRSCSSPRTSRS
jgi:uncharacterized surface protein with fasciclin (FAS1) repeats